jgi:hypothetical protein
MDELDQRIAVGLRELIDQAPVDATVWDDTARYVARHRRRRIAAAGAAAFTLAAGLVATAVVVGHAATPSRHVAASAPSASAPAPSDVTPRPTTPTPTTAPSTTAPTSTTVASQDVSAYVGTWAGHVGAVTIDADGNGSASWRVYEWCYVTHARPCDTIDANGLITDGGAATFRIADAGASSATAIVVSSTDTNAVPTGRVELRLLSGNRLQLGTLLVCGPRAAANACGA